MNGPRPRTSAILSKSESLACVLIARSAVASPRAGRVAGRSRFHRGVCDGCDPGDAHGPAPRASAGFTVASPQVGPLLRVAPAPAPRCAVGRLCMGQDQGQAQSHREVRASHASLSPAPRSHPRKRGPCSALRGRTPLTQFRPRGTTICLYARGTRFGRRAERQQGSRAPRSSPTASAGRVGPPTIGPDLLPGGKRNGRCHVATISRIPSGHRPAKFAPRAPMPRASLVERPAPRPRRSTTTAPCAAS